LRNSSRRPRAHEVEVQQYMKDYLRCVKAWTTASAASLMRSRTQAWRKQRLSYTLRPGFYNGEHGCSTSAGSTRNRCTCRLSCDAGVVKPGSRPRRSCRTSITVQHLSIWLGKVPDGLHGRSFVPVLRGEPPADWRKSIYYHYYDRGHGVAKHYGLRTEQYTLAHFYTTDEWELFDNEKDPSSSAAFLPIQPTPIQ